MDGGCAMTETSGASPAARDALYERLRAALAEEALPAVVVLLDAFDRNLALALAAVRGAGKTLRPTTKSLRVPALCRRLVDRGGGLVRGLQCMTAPEAALLAEEGHDDLLVAFPTAREADLRPLLEAVARAAPAREIRAAVVVDALPHVEALARAASRAGTEARAVIDVDVSWRPAPGVHMGVRRSPIRSPEDALSLALAARERGVRVAGIMGYEAHISGVPDEPFRGADGDAPGLLAGLGGRALAGLRGRAKGLTLAAYKRAARAASSDLRARVTALLRREGFALEVVNGGGTGTLESAARDATLTEVSPGSLFLGSHLYDRFQEARPEPACLFAIPVARASDPGLVTCQGGGWIASGAAGPDRLPLPWLPAGAALLPGEGAGEVQTPLRLPSAGRGARLAPGDPVFFRHAKAGEVMERVPEVLLWDGERISGRAPTYRGLGRAFV